MVDVHHIRHEASQIEAADLGPLTRARRLLKLSRKARDGARTLGEGIALLVEDCREEQAVRLQATCGRLLELSEELRSRARSSLLEGRSGGVETEQFPAFLG